MDQSHKVTLSEREMFLVLCAIERVRMSSWSDPATAVEYKTLFDRLELIFEGRT